MEYNFKPQDAELADDPLLQELAEVTADKPKPEPFRVIEPEPEPGTISDPEPPIKEITADPESLFSFKEQAKLYVQFADGIQALYLPRLYRKRHFAPGEFERQKELRTLIASGTQPEPKEAELIDRINEFNKYMNALPLDAKEEDILARPLAAVLQKYQHAPGPESALILAAFTVFAPRIFPAMGIQF
ncbi:MAG: hypothetical protein NTX61_08205 [Bacteroidetes bacterium]|nr:hypothetical protein [Bacteroidota bacterium]